MEYMTKKILSIPGGGILGLGYLSCLLKVSLYYDNLGIDFLNQFDVFCGVSVGSIIATGFALREKILEKAYREDPDFFKLCNISSSHLLSINSSTLIIKYLISLFGLKNDQVFKPNNFGLNGLIFSKYTDDKIKLFQTYLNYDLSDIPPDRTLIIKTININENNINLFTNCHNLNILPNEYNGNKYSTYLPTIVNWSCNIPSYFPISDGQVDGGIFSSNIFLECNLLFKNEIFIILSIKKNSETIVPPILDGLFGWISQYIKIFSINTQIINNFQKVLMDENIHEIEIDFKNFKLDEISAVSEIISIGENINIFSTVQFIDAKIIDQNVKRIPYKK